MMPLSGVDAKLRQATLHVDHAWHYGYIRAIGLEGACPEMGGDIKKPLGAAETTREETLREPIHDRDKLEIKRRAVEGQGPFAGLLPGSVRQQRAHHAACPVAIVHRSRSPER